MTSATENGNCSLPPPKPGGRPITYPRREIVNAIRTCCTGCSWRMLPHDLPPWRIVFHYFSTWRRDGAWQRVHDVHAELRQASPGQSQRAIIDSQSVKTTEKGGPEVTTRARR